MGWHQQHFTAHRRVLPPQLPDAAFSDLAECPDGMCKVLSGSCLCCTLSPWKIPALSRVEYLGCCALLLGHEHKPLGSISPQPFPQCLAFWAAPLVALFTPAMAKAMSDAQLSIADTSSCSNPEVKSLQLVALAYSLKRDIRCSACMTQHGLASTKYFPDRCMQP